MKKSEESGMKRHLRRDPVMAPGDSFPISRSFSQKEISPTKGCFEAFRQENPFLRLFLGQSQIPQVPGPLR